MNQQNKATFHEKAREIPERKSIRALTTERNITPISLDGRFRIVGERINPTGKKELQEKLRAGDLSLVMDMAEEQEKNIIRLLAKGDEEATGILFRSYHRLLWKPVFSGR